MPMAHAGMDPPPAKYVLVLVCLLAKDKPTATNITIDRTTTI